MEVEDCLEVQDWMICLDSMRMMTILRVESVLVSTFLERVKDLVLVIF